MAPNPQGAQDLHSIIEFKGQWYHFYHIAISGFPHFKESQGRIACYDKLFYNGMARFKWWSTPDSTASEIFNFAILFAILFMQIVSQSKSQTNCTKLAPFLGRNSIKVSDRESSKGNQECVVNTN